MKQMRFTLFLILPFLFISGDLYAQDLNAYKYVIVPKKFDFQKKENQYQLNALTKFLFNKKGITTLIDDEKQPEDLYNNPCLGLKVKVLDDSNMFTTKLAIQLADCRNATVYTSEEGRSKIKDLKKGHHDALRKAFQSIQALDYSFDPSLVKITSTPVENVAVKKTKVEKAKAMAKDTKDKVEGAEISNINKTQIQDAETGKMREITTEDFSQETKAEAKKENEKEAEEVPFSLIVDSTKNVLYAQNINNGFQLVDSTPKIVFKALKTLNDENSFYLENKAGILYKKDDLWYAEYYRDGVLIIEKLTIKF